MYFFGVMILMVTVILKVCDFFFFSESGGKLLIVSKAMQDTGEAKTEQTKQLSAI